MTVAHHPGRTHRGSAPRREPVANRGRARTGQRVATALILVGSLVAVCATPSSARAVGEPGLDQTIDRHQAVVSERTVIADGHVDIGPRLVDGSFTLLVHDDSQVPSVWRTLEDTVFAVGDRALQTVPDDATYSFLGADPGAEVHVVPQVQRADVVWVGWNTQDPAVMERIDRGATLTMHRVEGPGHVTMYLQSGNLGEPEVLWRSTIDEPQPIWVEVNTHTHANWVFTEPGVYLVQVEVGADLVGGQTVSDVRTLRFAVGDETSVDDAFAAQSLAPPLPAGADGSADEAGDGGPGGAGTERDRSQGGSGSTTALAVVGGAAVLAAATVWFVVRGERSRRRAAGARSDGDDPGADGSIDLSGPGGRR